MSEDPVFARSAWGTNRYVYNHRNPVGLALIVIAPIVAICAMIGLGTAPGGARANYARPFTKVPRT